MYKKSIKPQKMKKILSQGMKTEKLPPLKNGL
jgi:hypothetical protein